MAFQFIQCPGYSLQVFRI